MTKDFQHITQLPDSNRRDVPSVQNRIDNGAVNGIDAFVETVATMVSPSIRKVHHT
jgi:hypothetical protein